ncbi:flippase [Syntrophorhabdus aromaticivorans]|nr:flippase [Syntrophorhabdus aromaticivorans]
MGALSLMGLIGKGLQFLLFAVLTRVFALKEVGIFTTVVTLIWFMSSLTDLGVSHVLVREIARDTSQTGSLVSRGLVITGCAAIVAWVALIGISLAGGYADMPDLLIIVSGLAILGNTLAQTGFSAFRGFQRMEIQAILVSGFQLASALIGLALALTGFNIMAQVINIVTVSIMGALLTLVIVHRYFGSLRVTVDINPCKRLLASSLPVGMLFSYFVLMQWIGLIILGLVRPMAEVAVYGAAGKIFDGTAIIIGSSVLTLLPLMAKAVSESRGKARLLYERSIRLSLAFGLGVAVMFTFLADQVVVTVFGAAYSAAATPLRILGWSLFFATASGPMVVFLASDDEQLKKAMRPLGCLVLGSILLNLMLGSYLGYIGSSLAFLVISCSLFVLSLCVFRSSFGFGLPLVSMLLKPGQAGLVMGMCLWLLHAQHLAVSVPVGAIAFFTILGLSGECKEEPYRSLLSGRRLRFLRTLLIRDNWW